MTKRVYNPDIKGLADEDRLILLACNGRRMGRNKRNVTKLLEDQISIRDKDANDRRKNKDRVLVPLLDDEMEWERNRITGEVVRIMTTINRDYGENIGAFGNKKEMTSIEQGIPGIKAEMPPIHKFWYLEGEE
jgi:hypothetical protein